MPIEKTIRNRVFQEQKPLLDTSSIQNELDLLQFNEQLSKKSFASSKEITNGYQKKEDLNTDMNHEEIVCKTPPSQLDDASLESYVSNRGDDTDPLTCLKCKKMFLSKASLRNHGTTIDPCDESRVVISSTGGKIESRTCFKCDKTFSSCQGLRKHLKRIKSCDQEKEIVSTVIRRQSLTPKKTCSKCGKTFSSSQNLRIHMNRVKPCTQDRKNVLDPTTLSGETLPTIVTSMSSDELSKGAERTVRAKYQARKAYLVNRTKETETKLDLDKNAPDETLHESDKVESLSRGVKRPRVQEEPAQEHESAGSPSDVSGLTQPRTRTPSHTTTSKKVSTSEGKSGHQLNKGHNGDLLAGGCSCPPCVRRWARKLMIRMQQLEDEVLMLSREKSTGAATTKTASAKPRVDSEATQCLSESVTGGVISSFQAKPADIFESLINFSNAAVTSQLSERGVSNNEASTKLGVLLEADGQSLHNRDNLGGLQRVDDGNENQSVIASVMQAVNSDTQSLIDAYKHMNDQILLNERAVEESSSHVHALVGYSPTAATDFRRQVNELQASIGAEKTKRDVRVAALIAHVWKPRYEEFKSLFDTPFQNAPRNEQVYHKKWAEVASEIYMKDNIISELERQMEALGGGNGRSRYAEMGELSSKIAAEYAAKMALESKREDFYVGLVQSNSRIRTLVRNALL